MYRVTWGKMTTGVRCPFIIIKLSPAGSCVCIMCGHLEDTSRHLPSQQRQSPLSDKMFFSHVRNAWFNVFNHVLYTSRKSQETMGLFS